MDPDKFTPQRIDGLYGVFDLPEEKPRQRTSSLPIGRALAIMNGPSATHVYDEEQRSLSSPVGPPSSMREDSINHVDTVMSEDGPLSATGGPEAQHSSNVEPDPTSSNVGDQDMTEATVANSSEATTTTMVRPLGDQTPAAPSFSPTTLGEQPTSSSIIPSLSLTQPVIENENDAILTSEQRTEGQGSADVTSHSISVSAHSHIEYANNSADIPSTQPIVDQENVTVTSQQAVAHVHDAGDTTEITSTQNALDQEVAEESSPRVSAPETAEAEGERGVLDEPVQSTIEEANNRSQDASTQPVVEQASDLNVSSQQGLTAAQPIILEEGDTIDASVEPTNETQDDAGIVAQPVSTGAQPIEEEGSTVTNPVESNVEKGDEEKLAQEFVATHRRSARIAIAKSTADNQEDANPAPIKATTHKKRKAAGKKNDTKATSSPTSTPQKRKATTQDPSADYDHDSSDDEPHLPEPDIYVWPERSPAPESSPPPPKAKRRSGRLTTAKKARKSPSPPPAPPVKKEGTIDASIYPNSRLLQLPADVLLKILDLVLIHPNAVAKPKRKGPYRRIVEAERSHVLTVGFGKITRPPVKGSGKKSNVMKDVNTASPTHFFLICRGLRDVGILTYYRKNTFHFGSEFDLSQWAESLGSRRKFVKSVELKSNWNVFFSEPTPILQNGQTDDDAATAISFPRREDLDIRGGGILFTKTLRCLTDISIVNLTINANMPWSGRRPTMLTDAPLEMKAMCWDYARKHIDFMLENFRRGELDAPFIEMRPEIFFDWAWVEPDYSSFLARMIPGQSEEAVSLKRAVLGLDDENATESEDVEMQDE